MAFENLDPAAFEPNIPCYCFDTKHFFYNICTFRKIIDKSVRVLFSVKANPFLTGFALEYMDGVEVCSSGEAALAAGCTEYPSKITFGGVCKEESDWDFALKTGIRRFSVESLIQLHALEKAASIYDVSVTALIRISSGNQFGMDIEEAKICFMDGKRLGHTSVSGIHYYPGTMRMTVEDTDKDFDIFVDLLDHLKDFRVNEIEYGAGIGIDYFGNGVNYDVVESVAEKINCLANDFQVSYEAGRFLTADIGVYIARVVETKRIKGKRYIVLNGGRHQFTYHGGIMKLGKRIPQISVIQQESVVGMEKTIIVGALCNTGDILANEIEIPLVNAGDYIVFHRAGAYCVTEGAALFLSRDIPAVFVLQNGKFSLIREKTFNLGLYGIKRE